MNNWVACYSGVEYAERPYGLNWEGVYREVVEIIQRWRTPSGKCFRVLTTDHRVFDLVYEEHLDEWQIIPL